MIVVWVGTQTAFSFFEVYCHSKSSCADPLLPIRITDDVEYACGVLLTALLRKPCSQKQDDIIAIKRKMTIQIRHQLFIRTNTVKHGRQSIWFLHGFADSGLAYKEVFESPLKEEFNIYVVDLPGFGVSPIHPDFISIKEHAVLMSNLIKEETANQDKVNLVAHSLGGLIGTWVCQNLKEKINWYFNIEGNLTEADGYFSSKPLQFKSAKAFEASFKAEIFEIAKSEERYKRYYSSLRLADPEGMRNWSLTSQEHIKENKSGIEFKQLTCKKVYIWGNADTPKETQKFILENNIPNQLYEGIGHWHMVENSKQFYHDIHEKIKTG